MGTGGAAGAEGNGDRRAAVRGDPQNQTIREQISLLQ